MLSSPPQTFRNLTVCRPAHAPMTWAAIELDRIARGLDVPKAPKSKRAPKSAGPRMVNGADARLPSNLTPCTAPAFTGERPKSAASAASARRKLMAQCECRLCNLALHPALTFADHAAFIGALPDVPRQANVYGFERSALDRKLDAERRASLP